MSIDQPNRFLRQGKIAIDLDPAKALVLAPVDLRPLVGVAALVESTLATPEDFPNIKQALVPGDRVGVAVDPNVPQVAEVVHGVLRAFVGSDCERVDIVLGEDASEATYRGLCAIGETISSDEMIVDVHIHDPDNQEAMGYLAAGDSADPIYLNRILLEADLVLPVAVARPAGGLDPTSEAGGVFPAMADRNSQQRAANTFWQNVGQPKERKKSGDLSTEASWLLGIQVLVEVMPTMDGAVAQVAAGSPAGIHRVLHSTIESSWRRSAPAPPSLVIACIDGNAQQHNWGNVARAIYSASRIVDLGGTIAVCSEVSQPPGAAMLELASDDPHEEVIQRLSEARSRDALVAGVIARVREETRIVLSTNCPSETVEDLGLGVMNDLEDLARLASIHESIVILRGAQFCAVS